MNKILIDSHILIWLLYKPEEIGKEAVKTLLLADEIVVSLVSLLELAIKYRKGKFRTSPTVLLKDIKNLGAGVLGLTERHIINILDIDAVIKDPFDTLLMSQAKSEDIHFLTADTLILKNKTNNIIDARL